jgi:hypothetical protein
MDIPFHQNNPHTEHLRDIVLNSLIISFKLKIKLTLLLPSQIFGKIKIIIIKCIVNYVVILKMYPIARNASTSCILTPEL